MYDNNNGCRHRRLVHKLHETINLNITKPYDKETRSQILSKELRNSQWVDTCQILSLELVLFQQISNKEDREGRKIVKTLDNVAVRWDTQVLSDKTDIKSDTQNIIFNSEKKHFRAD